MEHREGYFTVAQLKGRGWTVPMIRKFLGEHDQEYGNGNWNVRLKRTTGMFLYLANRVTDAENKPEFQAAKYIAARRRRNR